MLLGPSQRFREPCECHGSVVEFLFASRGRGKGAGKGGGASSSRTERACERITGIYRSAGCGGEWGGERDGWLSNILLRYFNYLLVLCSD